jgi:predicted 3-demethylubiquinone-9 3-methyltransferase (glyoxalase superfamily)
MIPCANEKELEYYYEKLSAKPEAEMCGWVADKY